jgi:deoxyribodipyrimidine photo-lyase
MVKEGRVRMLNKGHERGGPVVYWMSRDQRVRDNWALLFAQEVALSRKESLAVLFCLVPKFLDATMRQYVFMLKGLQAVERDLKAKNIHFYLRPGPPEVEIPRFVQEQRVGVLVTDFDPLRIKRAWKNAVAEKTEIPFHEVDAHNIIPCWIASPKQEYGAYTLRPKIRRILSEYLEDFPDLKRHPIGWKGDADTIEWGALEKSLDVDRTVPEVDWLRSGERAARSVLREFVRKKLGRYDGHRNDPNQDALSDLSPYLHFGQISAQRVALEVAKVGGVIHSREAFLEELIVRRELSDNFCFYNPNYDGFEGFPDWAKKTLNEHRKDRRDHIYSLEEFEAAMTHDSLWNSAQRQMMMQGKMHGYLRMYWGKKILEWTTSPEEAMRVAIYLNDRYELDGRDPNGYVGVSWCVGGVHDRAWPERPIFGKIRYMSYNGCKSKFDVKAYVETYGV